jgi:hypothetical protein
LTTGAAANPHGAAASQESDPAAHEIRAAELRAAIPQWLDAASGFKPVPARNPSLPTLVGLLILIMCFFVVLTSLSMRDQKREQSVMTGLSQAFSKSGLAPESPAPEVDTRKLLGDLRAQLHAEVPLLSGVTPETADDYTLNLPRRLVFAEDGTSLASGFPGILDQAMRALRSGPADFAYEVEVALNAAQMNDKAIAGASAIAAALRKAGFANDAASVSLQPGDGETVSVTIRLRPNARVAPLGQP